MCVFAEFDLCPHISIKSDDPISFTDAEKKLVCGDPTAPAWKSIPENQAIFNLRSFLQARGYHYPSFVHKETKLWVQTGGRTKVTKLTVTGESVELPISRLRRIVGETLTPDLLDGVKQRLQQQLQSIGYPCPKISVEGNAKTGEVTAKIKTGPLQTFGSIMQEPVKDLDERLFNRYEAFELGKPYNRDFLELTVQRVLDAGVVQSTFFTTTCTPKSVQVHEKFVEGLPRVVRIGVGVDTEELLLGRASWKHARLGRMGSSIELAVAASARIQEFTSQANWYYLPYPSRHYLRPFLSIKHENQVPYEQMTGKLQLAPAITWDTQETGFNFFVGPTVNFVRTLRGAGPSQSQFLSFGTEFRITDHYFELFRAQPQTGFELKFQGNFTFKDFLSNVTAQRIRLEFEKLWNWRHFSPPSLILGIRGQAATTVTSETVASAALPADYRSFLGGSQDLQGFGLKELPGDDAGALTIVSTGVEMRFADLLPWGLQPFVFTDVGMLGRGSVSLDNPIFWSPGLGTRWQTSFGVIRSTLSYGLYDIGMFPSNHSHWQFYFSFGEEF